MQRNRIRSRILEKLKPRLTGDLYIDDPRLVAFGKDRSIYEIVPLAVVVPASLDDIREVIIFGAAENLSVTPRGGGSGMAGAGLGEGIMIALKRDGFLSTIVQFEVTGTTPKVTVEAGVYHDRLQSFLKTQGYYLPADPSSAAISQIGGNIATRASGPHALRYGSMDRYLEHLVFFTASGELVNTADDATIPARITDGLAKITGDLMQDGEAREILDRRKDMKIASGYNLSALLEGLPPGKVIARLFAGSVGTLGFITEATLRPEPYDPGRTAMILYFHNLAEAADLVLNLKPLGIAAMEIMNRQTVRLVTRRMKTGGLLEGLAHVLFLEFKGEDRFEQMDAVDKHLSQGRPDLAGKPKTAETEEEIETLWELRKQVLPLLSQPGPGLEALSVVNDVGVPPEKLAPFITDLQHLFEKHKMDTLIYGHAGNGNLHLRPLFDVSRRGLKKRIQAIADDVYELVFKYDGTISGEHGMGRVRAPYLEREWGEKVLGYMKAVKAVFDPADLFNPGVMFSNRPITDFIRPDLLRERPREEGNKE